MTPAELNKAIRAGEIFYIIERERYYRPLQILKAKTDGGLKGCVKVKTAEGWRVAEFVRRAGSSDEIYLRPEGLLTRAIN